MKRYLIGAILIVLTLIVLSPLVKAQGAKGGKPAGTGPGTGTGTGTGTGGGTGGGPGKGGKPGGGAGKGPKLNDSTAKEEAARKLVKKANGQPVGNYAVKHGRMFKGRIC